MNSTPVWRHYVRFWAITDARVSPGLGCSCSMCPDNRREHSKRGVVHLPLEAFPDSSSQAEVSTFLWCFHHALYYATMATNPWIEVFFSLSGFTKNGRLVSVFIVSIPSRGRNSVRLCWTRDYCRKRDKESKDVGSRPQVIFTSTPAATPLADELTWFINAARVNLFPSCMKAKISQTMVKSAEFWMELNSCVLENLT